MSVFPVTRAKRERVGPAGPDGPPGLRLNRAISVIYWPLLLTSVLLAKVLRATNRMADVTDRFLVVVLKTPIDDECRPGELS